MSPVQRLDTLVFSGVCAIDNGTFDIRILKNNYLLKFTYANISLQITELSKIHKKC